MSTAMETARRESSGWRMYVLAAYYLATGNVSLLIAGIGVFQLLLGLGIDASLEAGYEGNMAIMAGYLGIWGLTLILLGLGSYGILWANKVYGRAVHGEN